LNLVLLHLTSGLAVAAGAHAALNHWCHLDRGLGVEPLVYQVGTDVHQSLGHLGTRALLVRKGHGRLALVGSATRGSNEVTGLAKVAADLADAGAGVGENAHNTIVGLLVGLALSRALLGIGGRNARAGWTELIRHLVTGVHGDAYSLTVVGHAEAGCGVVALHTLGSLDIKRTGLGVAVDHTTFHIRVACGVLGKHFIIIQENLITHCTIILLGFFKYLTFKNHISIFGDSVPELCQCNALFPVSNRFGLRHLIIIYILLWYFLANL